MNRTHRLVNAAGIVMAVAFFLPFRTYEATQESQAPAAAPQETTPPAAPPETPLSATPQQAPVSVPDAGPEQTPAPVPDAAPEQTPASAPAPQEATPPQAPQTPAPKVDRQKGGLWQDRGNPASLDLAGGPGGKDHQPAGKFTFVKEDMEGTSPKFDVVDEQGTRWRVKLGEETRSETAATRLVWAAGYFTDEDYYLPELRVEKMPKLRRGSQYVSADGLVRDARLERKLKGQKKTGNWSWYSNPFVGTKELNGLRIMMALINNWDLKEINNSIYQEKGGAARYAVSDLGASFGRTGNPMTRSKDNLKDYRGTKFIQEVKADYVDFYMSSRPLSITAVDLPNYVKRTKMQDVAKHIPRADAKWLGQVLGQLSADQIRDCFRAAGYSPEEVEGYAGVVQERIAELKALPGNGDERQSVAGRR